MVNPSLVSRISEALQSNLKVVEWVNKMEEGKVKEFTKKDNNGLYFWVRLYVSSIGGIQDVILRNAHNQVFACTLEP